MVEVVHDAEEDVEGLLLDVLSLFHDEVGEVGEDGEPKPLLDAVPDLGVVWRLFLGHQSVDGTPGGLGFFFGVGSRNAVVGGVAYLSFSVSLVEINAIHLHEIGDDILLL